jgi:uridine kinase
MSGEQILSRICNGKKRPPNVVAWHVNNYLRSLDWVVDDDSFVDFVDTRSFEGMEVYRRSLSFLFVIACRKALGQDPRIRHSISEGYYWEFREGAVSEEQISIIKNELNRLIDENVPIERKMIPVDKARVIFQEQGSSEKAELFRWSGEDPLELYSCEGLYGFFYAPLAPSTAYLKHFDLKLLSPGMVLQFPTVSSPGSLPPFQASAKLSGIFLEYADWLRTLGLSTMNSFHERVAGGRSLEMVLISEAFHAKNLSHLAENICARDHVKVISIAGPSGSGKTTTANRLAIQLQVCGKRPYIISLDDFFVDREHTPRDAEGKLDFDVPEALDMDLLNIVLKQLFSGKEVTLPVFDFLEGRKKKGRTLHLEKDNILILEGIHGLNDQVASVVPDESKFKIFVSPLTGISLDQHNRTSTTDNRLLRRMVRDNRRRGYSAESTLNQWPSVIRGSMKYIFPYEEGADALFNSALPYELAVLKGYAEPLLRTVAEGSPVYGEARRLLSMLKFVPGIPSESVPNNSILREFIGGSCFE